MGKLWKGLIVAAMLALLPGCCLKHEWAEATCTEPKRCVKCGETEGLSLGHTWRDATCTEPRTCAVCKATQGEPLGHTWVDRTVDAPKTCSVCNATEGEPIKVTEYKFNKLTFSGKNWAIFLDHTIFYVDRGNGCLRFYDLAENEITTIKPEVPEGRGWAFDVYPESYYAGKGKLFAVDYDDAGNCSLLVYDERGTQIASLENVAKVPEGHYISPSTVADNRYLRFYDRKDTQKNAKPVFGLDLETLQIVPTEDMPVARWYDGRQYGACNVIPNSEDKYMLAYSLDYTKMYLVHPVYYSIKAECLDFSGFNELGYALISEDGVNYNLIDRDLNVLGTNVLSGSDADWAGKTIFSIKQGDEYKYYSVE